MDRAEAILVAYEKSLENAQVYIRMLEEILEGAWVNYDKIPYQMGTVECDRIDIDQSTAERLYRLDKEAVKDLPGCACWSGDVYAIADKFKDMTAEEITAQLPKKSTAEILAEARPYVEPSITSEILAKNRNKNA